jgi:putative copper resistance protein D
VLVPLARTAWLRSLFRRLRRPLVAVPLYVLVLYGWHFRFAFQGALEHPLVHLLQHQSFFVASLLVWWSAVDPKHRRVGGELWKIGHIVGVRLAGMFLGMAFVLMRTQAYPWYADRAHLHGIDPIRDQQYGGGLMFLTDMLVMFFALGFFFWRAAADNDRAEDERRRRAAAVASS